MGVLVAVLQSDPKLMRCQVQRLDTHVALTEPDRLPSAYGFGYYHASDVLLGKRPSGAPVAMRLAQLTGAVDTHALVAHARYRTVGELKDENTHPFRFRRWLFAHDGTVEAWPEVKPRIVASLPEFLRRNIEGETDSEHAFMIFLRHLREAGLVDDLDADARAIGRALAQTVRDLEALSREAGATKPGTLNFVATNGRALVATRRGRPLHYALLEGIIPCARDGIGPGSSESDPRVRPHRQVKAVCFATKLLQPNGFLEVPDASVVSVNRQLEVAIASLANP
ncbi:MAG: class II glutamine amidotransferase [Anaeromyxobacteraceae bacterium]